MENIIYKSTRGHGGELTASQAILQGLAPDGGLYVPDHIPPLDFSMAEAAEFDYKETAYRVMRLFLTDYTEEELREATDGAYDSKFDTEDIVLLREASGAYYLELFHGKTIAFKDMALSVLPRLMTAAARKNGVGEDIVILTATSGDTGKAALAGFADVPGTRIIVFYPKNGVSPVQELQMVTERGRNTAVVGVAGNFDDAQNGVKAIFEDKSLGERMRDAGYRFSSANSINIGRLVPQIVYYVYAYSRLLRAGTVADGEPINVAVPTGNFGNILAAHYAKLMGTPIGELICASNDNRVLTDFFEVGVYDKNRPFYTTSSPSMDILISSNLERLIYELTGGSTDKNGSYMAALRSAGRYGITEKERRGLSDFYAGCANEAEVAGEIARLYKSDGYIVDTHTAVASCVYGKYRAQTGDTVPTVIASTASPYKFARSVMTAIDGKDGKYDAMDDFELTDELRRVSGVAVPPAVAELRGAPVLHTRVTERDGMKAAVCEILGL